MDGWIYELLGYAASLLIAISLMMRSVLRLRLINLAGSVCFTVYGLAIRAYPVAFMNTLIVLINLYYLYEMTRSLSTERAVPGAWHPTGREYTRQHGPARIFAVYGIHAPTE